MPNPVSWLSYLLSPASANHVVITKEALSISIDRRDAYCPCVFLLGLYRKLLLNPTLPACVLTIRSFRCVQKINIGGISFPYSFPLFLSIGCCDTAVVPRYTQKHNTICIHGYPASAMAVAVLLLHPLTILLDFNTSPWPSQFSTSLPCSFCLLVLLHFFFKSNEWPDSFVQHSYSLVRNESLLKLSWSLFLFPLCYWCEGKGTMY